jgi:hypothetical protein
MLNHRGGIYSAYTSQGGDSPVWKAKGWASMAAMLAAFLNDPDQNAEDKNYAATILKWELDKEAASSCPEVVQWWSAIDLSALWENPSYWVLQDVTIKGKTSVECVCTQSPFSQPVPKAAAQIAAPAESEDEI